MQWPSPAHVEDASYELLFKESEMDSQHDLIFTGVQNPGRQRVDGQLFFSMSGKRYKAVSGSRTLLPLPNGGYIVSLLRLRDKAEMALEVKPDENDGGGMCFPAWSADIAPLFCTQRTLLRIHPDGNLPGTQGCIGIVEEVHNCFADLKLALQEKTQLLLLVNHNNNDSRLIG
jgi:hypothetical protein